MLLCRNRAQHSTCNTPNRDGSQFCQHCGRPLQNALYVHDAGKTIRRYRILRPIGHGNFGAVYEAEVISHPQVHVALKESIDDDAIPEFATEFAVLNRLRHPNLPRYYEMFEHGGSGFLVMDFVHGQSLHHIVQRQRGPLSEQMVFGYADQICEVLTYLHSHSPPVIHRDIKPPNILLTAEGEVKLVDFGLVKQGPEQMANGTARAGTLYYAPPEQWLGGTDTRSDIYNFGATLYHLLTGQVPPPGIYRQHARPDTLRAPAAINPRVTAALSAVVMRAMHLDPEQRFPAIGVMHQALLDARRRTVATRPLTTPPMGTPRPKAPTSLLVSRLGATRPLDAARLASPPAAATLGPARPRTIRPLLHWPAHADMVNAVAWSQDGRMLASAGGDGRVALWNIGSGSSQPAQIRASTTPQGNVLAVAWSPDGRLLASGGRAARVVIARASDGHPVAEWAGHASYITALTWSPDGQLVASAGWDGVVRLWRASDGYLLAALSGHTQSVSGLSWSPDSRQLASSASGCLRIWDVERQQASHVLPLPARAQAAVAWGTSGPLAALGGADGQIQLQPTDGRPPTEIAPRSGAAISALAWDPEGQTLAYMHAGTQLRLWQRGAGAPIELAGRLATPIGGLAWRPGGRLLAGASAGRHIHVWELCSE